MSRNKPFPFPPLPEGEVTPQPGQGDRQGLLRRDLRIVRSGGVKEPLVYLDQWALQMFSKELVRGGRLLRVLRRGTLLFSLLNLLEMVRAKGRSVGAVIEFLDALGPRWAFMEVNPHPVAQREEAGLALPWLDHWLYDRLRELGIAPGGSSLSAAISHFQRPWAADFLKHWENRANEVADFLTNGRSGVREGTLDLDDDSDPPARSMTARVQDELVARLTKGTLRLDRSQMDDLLHACVPLAHADVVFLDKRTAGLTAGLTARARTFWKQQVDDALFYLENGWCRG